jgi:hypothetical protein
MPQTEVSRALLPCVTPLMTEGRVINSNPRRRGDGGRQAREEESPPKEGGLSPSSANDDKQIAYGQ